MIRIGIVGKTNTGKTTFFNSATLLHAEAGPRPFTTTQPNVGTAYVQTICVCRELRVQDNPRNSACIDGWRFIPVELVDLPGLIEGSWQGKGLGNQFLSVAAQADALLHLVDASGSVDAEGKLTRPGQGNPVADIYDVEQELNLWLTKIVEKSVEKIKRRKPKETEIPKELLRDFAGLRMRLSHIQTAIKQSELEGEDIIKWTTSDIKTFAKRLREQSKPTLIIANKMDLAPADKNYGRLAKEFGEAYVIPCSSEAELALRRAEQKGYIKYVPGEETFRVLDAGKLTPEQSRALSYVEQRVFLKWVRTGVQFALNVCAFKLLNLNTVYPVEDEHKFSDHKGSILPDAFLVPYDASVSDLAMQIHSELAETMIYAIDARSGSRLPTEYVLKDRDVIKIVAAARPRKKKT